MKHKRIVSLVMALGMMLSISIVPTLNKYESSNAIVASAANESYSFLPEYRQTEARNMLSAINSFRTGPDAWEWNQANTEKIYHSNLGNLTFDYELERVAMQRAAELVASYSHTRPNGERSFTAYTSTYDNSYRGENIAIGFPTLDVNDAFNGWREDNDYYSGQGHRRNMLKAEFKSIGIAHVYYNGCHYWVQEFSSKIGSTVKTPAEDSALLSTVEIESSTITSTTVSCDTSKINLNVGGTADIPEVTVNIRTSGTWSYAPDLSAIADANWSISSGSDVISVKNGKITALKAGNASITTTVKGVKKVISIEVKDSSAVTAELKYQLMNAGDDIYGVRFVLIADEEAVRNAESASVYISVPYAGDSDTLVVKRAYKSLKAGGKTVYPGEGKVFLLGKFIGIPSDFLDGLTGHFKLDSETYDRTVVFN